MFQIETTFLWLHCIVLIQKRLLNQRQEVCVTFATYRKGKNCTTELSNLLLQILWGKYRTNLEQVKIDAIHLSGSKASVNHSRISVKIVTDFFSLRLPKKFVRGPFLHIWKSLVFLKIFGAAHLSGEKIVLNHRMGYHKKLSRVFVSNKSLVRRLSW